MLYNTYKYIAKYMIDDFWSGAGRGAFCERKKKLVNRNARINYHLQRNRIIYFTSVYIIFNQEKCQTL